MAVTVVVSRDSAPVASILVAADDRAATAVAELGDADAIAAAVVACDGSAAVIAAGIASDRAAVSAVVALDLTAYAAGMALKRAARSNVGRIAPERAAIAAIRITAEC